jgi:hypothetical protein
MFSFKVRGHHADTMLLHATTKTVARLTAEAWTGPQRRPTVSAEEVTSPVFIARKTGIECMN